MLQEIPHLGRSHRHQCLDSVRPAAVNRRPASKPNCGRSQKCVQASRQLAAPLALRCNARCTFVDDRPVCGYGRSLRRCPCAAARASVADRSAGARGTEFTTRTDLQSQTGTSGPKWSENQGARMFNNNLGVSHYIPPMPVDAASSHATDPSVSLIPHHCSCPSATLCAMGRVSPLSQARPAICRSRQLAVDSRADVRRYPYSSSRTTSVGWSKSAPSCVHGSQVEGTRLRTDAARVTITHAHR